ncbi:MAG: peptide chain release factor N(5)-glutamine methyltransferase, partial [Pseudomonadota bacterium]
LVAHVLGLDTAALIAHAQHPPPPGLSATLDPLLNRRAARVPLAHILGHTEFYGLTLLTDERALIPRSDSETVVELALDLVPPGSGVIADLGTGSGALLLAILSRRPDLTGIGIDASDGAIALAEANAIKTGLSDRAGLRVQSWADWSGWGKADLIVSNPPYICAAEIDTLQPEVRDHDPRLALDGGPDGLAAYREIIGLGAQSMKPGAWLVMEIGHDQREAVLALLAHAGYVDGQTRKDLGGNDRVVAARRPQAVMSSGA